MRRRGERKQADTGQLAALMGVPTHLVAGVLAALKGLALETDAGQKAARSALNRFCIRAFEAGQERGAGAATAASRGAAADVGRAYVAALRAQAAAGGAAPWRAPTTTEVAAQWVASGARSVLSAREVRALCVAAGLELAPGED